MTTILTETERHRRRLRHEIETRRRWLDEDSGDRRAIAFHRGKITLLEAELERVSDAGACLGAECRSVTAGCKRDGPVSTQQADDGTQAQNQDR